MNKTVLVILGLGVVAAAVFWLNKPGAPTQTINVTVPKLTAEQSQGQTLFDKNCASCHGKNAVGTKSGPPFIHKIYEPNHHGDGAFYYAAKNGVRAHHWPVGNMPPVKGVGDGDVKLIVDYVRALQKANGIF